MLHICTPHMLRIRYAYATYTLRIRYAYTTHKCIFSFIVLLPNMIQCHSIKGCDTTPCLILHSDWIPLIFTPLKSSSMSAMKTQIAKCMTSSRLCWKPPQTRSRGPQNQVVLSRYRIGLSGCTHYFILLQGGTSI